MHRHRRRSVEEAAYYFTIEAAVSLGVSFLINAAVVAVFAKAFYSPVEGAQCDVGGGQTIACSDIGLYEAGGALRAAVHEGAKYVWGVRAQRRAAGAGGMETE